MSKIATYAEILSVPSTARNPRSQTGFIVQATGARTIHLASAATLRSRHNRPHALELSTYHGPPKIFGARPLLRLVTVGRREHRLVLFQQGTGKSFAGMLLQLYFGITECITPIVYWTSVQSQITGREIGREMPKIRPEREFPAGCAPCLGEQGHNYSDATIGFRARLIGSLSHLDSGCDVEQRTCLLVRVIESHADNGRLIFWYCLELGNFPFH
ncbi:hypothetical protein C8J57DRAFT_1232776 [Mycena rebaudengoi]|nr:hypothetical protein C8J57DRAFT_1232776 [Mycena rebaudengoi]